MPRHTTTALLTALPLLALATGCPGKAAPEDPATNAPTGANAGTQDTTTTNTPADPGTTDPTPAPTIDDARVVRVVAADHPPVGHPFHDRNDRSPLHQADDTFITAIPAVDLRGTPPPDHPIRWDQAAEHINWPVTVVGTVVRTGRARNNWPQFLDFETGDANAFNVVLFANAAADLPEGEDPASYYLGKTLRITHTVSSYRGRVQFAIEEPGLIEIVDPDDYAELNIPHAPLDLEDNPPPDTGPNADGPPEPAPDTPDDAPVVPWDQAHEHVGETITVTGTIVDTYFDEGNPSRDNDGAVFLNFHEEWRGKFYIVTFPRNYANFGDQRPDQRYERQTIHVTGLVELYQERPRIELIHPDQVTLPEAE